MGVVAAGVAPATSANQAVARFPSSASRGRPEAVARPYGSYSAPAPGDSARSVATAGSAGGAGVVLAVERGRRGFGAGFGFAARGALGFGDEDPEEDEPDEDEPEDDDPGEDEPDEDEAPEDEELDGDGAGGAGGGGAGGGVPGPPAFAEVPGSSVSAA